MKKQVGIWIRVSTPDQAAGDSPETHLKRAQNYTELKGWEVKEIYDLAGFSGKTVMEHPETKRMLEDIKQGRIEALIFSKLARFGRNTKELLEFADYFQKYDAALVSLQEAIDTSTPVGKLFYTVIGALAEWEREEIASRVQASIPIRAKEGKSLGGAAPYGYQWVNKQLEINEDEAPIRKLIFELFVELKRKKAVARALNDKGLRTRTGKPFTDTTLDRLLKDRVVIGERIVNYSKRIGNKQITKDEKDWVVVQVPAIVPEELFYQVQAIFESQKRKPVAKRVKHQFAGIVKCHCGQKMYNYTNSPTYVCKPCKNRIALADLDTIYYEQLQSFLLTPEELQSYLSQADSELKKLEQEVSILSKERTKIKNQMDKVYDLYMDDRLTKDGFELKYKPLEERYFAIEEELPKLQANIDHIKVTYYSTDNFAYETKNLFESWNDFDREKKRHIIELLTESIIVHEDEVELNLHFVPDLVNTEKLATEPLLSMLVYSMMSCILYLSILACSSSVNDARAVSLKLTAFESMPFDSCSLVISNFIIICTPCNLQLIFKPFEYYELV